MYSQDFYISDPVGNNAFSYEDRPHKSLFVPKLKKIESFDEIKLHHYLSPTLSLEEREQITNKVTFEEYDFDGKMQTCYGLENLYELEYIQKKSPQNVDHIVSPLNKEGVETQGNGGIMSRKIPLYLVDNHNHVFYFWYLARQQGIIADGARVYHIDEHADMRDPGKYLLKPESEDLQKVFEYTNFFLNVGNYIMPAQKEGLIGEVIQIRGESALEGYQRSDFKQLEKGKKIILNLDLDFFEPELDFVDYDLKKQVILDIAQKADLITVCTSPYFIDQERALEVFRNLFDTM